MKGVLEEIYRFPALRRWPVPRNENKPTPSTRRRTAVMSPARVGGSALVAVTPKPGRSGQISTYVLHTYVPTYIHAQCENILYSGWNLDAYGNTHLGQKFMPDVTANNPLSCLRLRS